MILYAPYWSDTIIVSGTIYCLICVRRVAESHHSTETTKHLLLPRSVLLKRHSISMILSLLDIFLLRSASSISTNLPRPPTVEECLLKRSVQTNLKKFVSLCSALLSHLCSSLSLRCSFPPFAFAPFTVPFNFPKAVDRSVPSTKKSAVENFQEQIFKCKLAEKNF